MLIYFFISQFQFSIWENKISVVNFCGVFNNAIPNQNHFIVQLIYFLSCLFSRLQCHGSGNTGTHLKCLLGLEIIMRILQEWILWTSTWLAVRHQYSQWPPLFVRVTHFSCSIPQLLALVLPREETKSINKVLWYHSPNSCPTVNKVSSMSVAVVNVDDLDWSMYKYFVYWSHWDIYIYIYIYKCMLQLNSSILLFSRYAPASWWPAKIWLWY